MCCAHTMILCDLIISSSQSQAQTTAMTAIEWQSCPVLPTTVLDSSDSLTLSFQSWEDPGFLGHPRTLPSCPSHQAAHAVRRIPWDPPLVSLHRNRAPCCPEDSYGHPGILPSSSSHTTVWRILWTSAIPRTSRGPPFKSLSHSCLEDPLDILGSSLHVPLTQLPHAVW